MALFVDVGAVVRVTEELWGRIVDSLDRNGVPVPLSFASFRKTRKALDEALADVPEHVPGPFSLSASELQALDEAHRLARHGEAVMYGELLGRLVAIVERAACALAPPAPKHGAFTLSEDEAGAVASLKLYVAARNHTLYLTEAARLIAALERAQSTLAAPAAEPLDEEIRRDAEWVVADFTSRVAAPAAELLRRFPKLAKRTADEIRTEILNLTGTYAGSAVKERLDELVALAKAGKP